MKDTTGYYYVLNTGARIPAVGLGTWQTGGDVCCDAVRTALGVGYRHIDCAHLYGNEVEVGQALSDALSGGVPGLKREDLFVTSKLLFATSAPKRIEEAIQVSLRNLKLSYLDLFLLHWPVNVPVGDATDPPYQQGKPSLRIKEAWQSMESLVENGLARAIGVSNFNISQLEELLSYAKINPAVNQVELHPFWRQDDLVQFCQSRDIHVSAHTPLGVPGSNLKNMQDDAAEGEHELLSPSFPIVFTRSLSGHAPMLKMSIVELISQRLNKTSAQVILRWGIQRGTSVLPRSLHPERIKSNFDILSWCLSEEDWNEINMMGPQLRLIDSRNSLLSPSNEPLQAVQEIDDNDLNAD